VSQLKKKLESGVIIQENIPSYVEETVKEHEKIIDRRIVLINNKLSANFSIVEGAAWRRDYLRGVLGGSQESSNIGPWDKVHF